MYSTCLHCTRDLGRNEMVETLPIGRRLAFDADKGRLWVVCPSCGKWNLVPFDTRLESIDACERLFRDTRTRYSTDNIGMAKVGDGLTLVRVGKALRPEFASWRYGEQYRKRRRTALTAAGLGGIVVVGAAVGLTTAAGVGIGGFGFMLYQAGQNAYKGILARRARFRTRHQDSGQPVTLGMDVIRHAAIVKEGDVTMLRVPRTAPVMRTVHHFWTDDQVAAVGRRIAAGLNLTVGREREIAAAVDHLGHYNGDLTRWLAEEGAWQRKQRLSGPVPEGVEEAQYRTETDRDTLIISQVRTEQRLALEMWFSEDIERRWLEGELRLLEREWREAEKLAKIADDLVLDPQANLD